MSTSYQITLLLELAEEIKSKPRSKEEALKSLVAAKILTKKGNFTSHYPNLKKADITAK